ncbi:MAG: patatin family protein [Bacteroidota bacterium]
MKALILEGGGMRGIFSAGVLAAFYESEYDPFDMYMGVSAGACNLASYLGGNTPRNHLAYTQLMTQKHFINWQRFLQGKHLMDLDWLWKELADNHPIDRARVASHHFVVVATNIATGRPHYFRPTAANLEFALKASCALPAIYKGYVELDAEFYTDGSLSDPIPIKYAIEQGATEITVLRSRQSDFFKERGWKLRLWASLVKNGTVKSIIVNSDKAYNEALDLITSPPVGITVHNVAPELPLNTSNLSKHKSKLELDFQQGFEIGQKIIREKL